MSHDTASRTTASHGTTARAHRRARPLALLTAAVLAAGGLVLGAAAPASATVTDTVTDATLSWGLNDYSSVTLSAVDGNATAATDTSARAFVLSGGTGLLDASGDGEIDFDASLTFAYTYAGDLFTVTAPVLTITDDGTAGTLTVLISGSYVDSSASGTRVTMADFTIDSLSLSDGALSFTAVPAWEDVVEAGTYSSGQTDAWPSSWVTAMASSTRAFWYASGGSSDSAKAPLDFTVVGALAVPTVSASITASSYDSGLAVAVSGDGFRAVTETGDAGVYVGLAASGGLPDVSTTAGAASFVTAVWISADELAEGAFSTTLTAAASALDSSASYSVYTWQAHAHSNTTQDTETALAIDFSTLQASGDTGTTGDTGGTSTGSTSTGTSAGTSTTTTITTTVTTGKAAVTIKTVAQKRYKKGAKAVLKVKVGNVDGKAFTGKVTIRIGGKVVKTVRFTKSDAGVKTIKLPAKYSKRSSITARVVVAATSTTTAASKTVTLKRKR
ncbi:MAG: hypothetical protein QM635_09185 [Microbacteriaceae bacterium]